MNENCTGMRKENIPETHLIDENGIVLTIYSSFCVQNVLCRRVSRGLNLRYNSGLVLKKGLVTSSADTTGGASCD